MVIRYKIEEVLDWDLHDETLREALVDTAERDLRIVNEEGEIAVTVEGDEFVCTFKEA